MISIRFEQLCPQKHFLIVLISLAGLCPAFAQTNLTETANIDTLLTEVRSEFSDNNDLVSALSKMGDALERDPQNPKVNYTAGWLNEKVRNFERALIYYNRAARYDPEYADAWASLGVVSFQLGRFEDSVRNFDKYLELVPTFKPDHWQRGISCYLAGKYNEGAKQFELHQTVNSSDVENAFWHFICQVQIEGLEKARKEILPIESDPRVPMMEIYSLIKGESTPLNVLNAVHRGNPGPEELKNRQCYAHLYLGLYFEATGDPKQAYDHFELAAGKYYVPHYMGDVARVRFESLKQDEPEEE